MLRKQFASTPDRINFFDRPRGPAPSRDSAVRDVAVEIPQSLQAALSVEEKSRIKGDLSQKLSDLQGRLHVSKYTPMRSSPMLVTEAHHLVSEATDIERRLGDGLGPDHVNGHPDPTYVQARCMSAMIRLMMIALGER